MLSESKPYGNYQLCRRDTSKGRSINAFGSAFSMKPEGGFTLLELLVVIVILAGIAALVAPRLFGVMENAKSSLVKQQISNIGALLSLYKLDCATFPSSADGLEALAVKPPDESCWRGPYAQHGGVPLDPWNHPWRYASPSARPDHDYDLCSGGPQGLVEQGPSLTQYCNE